MAIATLPNFYFVTLLLSSFALLLTVICVAVPMWVAFSSPLEHHFGLFEICSSTRCVEHSHAPQFTGCNRMGQKLRDRIDAISSIFFVGILLLTVFTVISSRCVWFQKVISGKLAYFLFFLLVAAAVAFLIAVCLFHRTMQNWLSCGQSLCAALHRNDCSYGFSFHAAVALTIGIFCVSLLFIADHFLQKKSVLQHVKGIFCVLTFIGTLMALFSNFSSRWIEWDDSQQTVGLWASCNSSSCTRLSYPEGTFISYAGCQREYNDLKKRNAATASLLVVSSISTATICVFSALLAFGCIVDAQRARKGVLLALIAVSFLLSSLALAIQVNTLNSWYNCGQHYCANKENCGYSISAIASIVSLVVLLVLLVLHIAAARYKFSTELPPPQSPRRAHSLTFQGMRHTPQIHLPPGEWMSDAGSGYYWSVSRNEFWDPDTGYTFNPDIGKWKDPKTGAFV